MKKLYALLLTVLMMFSLTACNAANDDSGSIYTPPLISTTDESLTESGDNSADFSQNTSTESSSQADSSSSSSTENSSSSSTTDIGQPQQSSSTSQSSSAPQSSSKPQSSSTQQSSSTPQSSLPPQSQPEPAAPKVLVAYFSATNTTEGVAKRISEALNADLYEITPAIPYTSADLNYGDDNSRTSIEMNDTSSRPAISGSVNNMGQYDIVFIGYPIWWGDAPRILSTFVESYNFSGKTVVPFCTSGGSGVGSSARNLERLSDGGIWLDGTRLNGSASKNDIVSWINGLGPDIAA